MSTWGKSTSLSIVDHVMGLFDAKSITTPIFFLVAFPKHQPNQHNQLLPGNWPCGINCSAK